VDAERGVPFSVRGGTGPQLEDEDSGEDPGVPMEAGAEQVQGLIHGGSWASSWLDQVYSLRDAC